MRGVIEHAPAEAPGMFPGGHGRVLHARMAQRVLLPPRPGVKGLRGEHVAVALGDEKGLVHIRRDSALRLRAGGIAGVGKVVIGIDILKQAALFQIAHAGGSAGGVERMGEGVRFGIEAVIVEAFVYPDAPEYYRRVISVLRDHLAHVFHRLTLPRIIADMLPAGDLREHEKSKLVAGVDEMPALRVVRGAHGIAAKLLLQYARVLDLQAFRRGIADVGIALVAVEAAKEGPFPVEIEAVRPEFRRAEAEAVHRLVKHLSPIAAQHGAAQIQVGARRIPRLRRGHVKAHVAPLALRKHAPGHILDRNEHAALRGGGSDRGGE